MEVSKMFVTLLNPRYLGGLYLAVAASIWGGMYVISKIVLETVPPLELVWLRYVVALAALLLTLLVTRQPWRIGWKNMLNVIAIGVIGYDVSIWAQFRGTQLSSAQMGAVITSATPAFMVIFARILLGERVNVRKALSVGLSTVGVLMVIGVRGFAGSHTLGGLILGLAALTWALMSVLVKRVPSEISPLTMTTYAIFVATVVLTPTAIKHLSGMVDSLLHPEVWGGVLYLGVVSTAGAFYLWNKGLQMVDATTSGVYFFFQPLVGTMLGWLILGETVGLLFWLGAVLILSSVLLVLRDS
jgi:drug/metabolite transporter (DMT)-like permease